MTEECTDADLQPEMHVESQYDAPADMLLISNDFAGIFTAVRHTNNLSQANTETKDTISVSVIGVKTVKACAHRQKISPGIPAFMARDS